MYTIVFKSRTDVKEDCPTTVLGFLLFAMVICRAVVMLSCVMGGYQVFMSNLVQGCSQTPDTTYS